MIHFKPALREMKESSGSLFIIPFLIVFLAPTLSLARILNIWLDEAYTLNTTGKSVVYALHRALHFELQASFFFMPLSVWRNINDAVLFARAFPLLSVVNSIFIMSVLSGKLFPRRNTLWMVAWLFLNPLLIWAALKIRLDGFLLHLASLSLYLFFLAYNPTQKRFWLRRIFILVTIVSVHTQYYLEFLLVFQAIGSLSWAYYCKDTNTLTPLPDRDIMTVWDPGAHQVIHNEKNVADALGKSGRPPEEFWLVRNGEEACLSGPYDFDCGIVDRYVSENFSVESEQVFYRNRVQLLKRK